MTAAVGAYVPLTSVIDPAGDAAAVQALTAMQRCTEAPKYTVQVFRATAAGVLSDDLTAWVVRGDDQVVYDGTAANPSNVNLTLDAGLSLQWGADILAVFQLVRSEQYNRLAGYPTGTWIRFPLGHHVATTPGFDDLDRADVHAVTGYGKNYLLQNDKTDGLAFAAGSTYLAAVTAVFTAAGVLISAAALSTVCDYPGDWATKTLPSPRNYPLDDGKQYLDVVNDLLTASGCRNLYIAPSGRWQVQQLVKPTLAAPRWRWAGSRAPGVAESDLDVKVWLVHGGAYTGDVWGAVNQWVFVQQGLTFAPVANDGSDGRYVVNNINTPPAGQAYVGRVIRSTQYLAASGAADLRAQGDAIVDAALTSAEKVALSSAPWPAARHLDVFLLSHAALPLSSQRRLQAQRWTLPLWGDPMKWETLAVAQS